MRLVALVQKLGPVLGDFKPRGAFFDAVVEHRKCPHLPGLQPDEFIGVEDRAVEALAGVGDQHDVVRAGRRSLAGREHAVLLAALGRAAGIPTRIEAGLVYLKGRFYYHAWNLMYLCQWITVDPVFGQLPADVSHLRFVTGSPERQLDIMGVIGKIRLTVLK